MRFSGPFRCVMCEKAEKTIDHLFLNCDFAHLVSSYVMQKLNWQSPLSNRLWDWLEAWPTGYNSWTFVTIWKDIPSTTLWELWKERNRRLFHEKVEKKERFLQRVEKAISEVVSNAAAKVNPQKVPFSRQDVLIQ